MARNAPWAFPPSAIASHRKCCVGCYRLCSNRCSTINPANIALNFLDWTLHQAKLRFVRYADDFVILCWSKHRAEEARKLVERCLTELGLKLSHRLRCVTRGVKTITP